MGKDMNEEEFKRIDLGEELKGRSPESFVEFMRNEIKFDKENNKDVKEKEEILELAEKALHEISVLSKSGEGVKDLVDRLKRDIQDYSHWNKITRGDEFDAKIPKGFPTMKDMIQRELKKARIQNKLGDRYIVVDEEVKEKGFLGKFFGKLTKHDLKQSSEKIKENIKSMDSDSTLANIKVSSKSPSRKSSKESIKSIDSDKTM